MFNKIRYVASIVIVLILVTCGSIPLNTQVSANGSGTYPPPITGDWIIANETYVGNETILLNGNLTIQNGGSLTLSNVTLIMNCTLGGEFKIEVQNGGVFNVQDRSNITSYNSTKRYGFRTYGNLTIKDSEIHYAGYTWGTNGNSTGVWINSNDTIIENSIITHGIVGLFLYQANNCSIVNNTFYTFKGLNTNEGQDGGISSGIYLLSSSNVSVINNNISDIIGGIGGRANDVAGIQAGTGGTGAGIYIDSSNEIYNYNNTISEAIGGVGGFGAGWFGGIGGIGAGIYLSNSYNNFNGNNTISNNKGGRGGNGEFKGSFSGCGGRGGHGVGVYISSSTNNTFENNTISNLTGGAGGAGGFWAPPGNPGSRFGVFVETDSYQNIIDKSNTLDNESIFYFYGCHSPTIIEYQSLRVIGSTNLGKIVLIACSNFTLRNNTVSGSIGYNGEVRAPPHIDGTGGDGRGVFISSSTNITIINNTIKDNFGGTGGPGESYARGGIGGWGIGVYMEFSSAMILNNNISNNRGGDGGPGGYSGPGPGRGGIGAGIRFLSSTNSTIVRNKIHGNYGGDGYIKNLCDGIYLRFSSNNSIINNNISDHQYAVVLSDSLNNSIYHNNFIDNRDRAADNSNQGNQWDDGYPSGGNYWSDYTGKDSFKGPNQDIPGNDGIGDTNYSIDSDSIDHYPLMNPFGNYNSLKEGWNLVSIPLIQSNQNLLKVLELLNGSYDAVQWYNNSDTNDPWKHNKIGKPFGNDLNELNETMGFWIHITQPGDTIFLYNGTQPTSNQTIFLHPGWNLVGYPSLTSYNRTEGLNNLTFGTHVDSIWTYYAATQKWKEITELDYFEFGRGYWIHAKTKCEWEVPL